MARSPAFRAAFAGEARRHRAASVVKAAWWSGNAAAGRAMLGAISKRESPAPAPAEPSSPNPSPGRLLRRAWSEAFRKDVEDVAAGLYPSAEPPPADPVLPLRRALDVFSDARSVEARRQQGRGTEIRNAEQSRGYPAYYRQNFHYQSGGWFTAESARRYESQVETLFGGAAGPMRRRALSLLAKAWRDRDHRGAAVLDLACGSGSFLRDLKATFPRAAVLGLDLSAPYLDEARARSGAPVVQANAERLPMADASVDAVTCVFLFHELPPRVRPVVAAEIARVLRPGGLLAFADAVQAQDEPGLARPLQAFPEFFHEPYFASYQQTDLAALFGAAGLIERGGDIAFLTKAMLFEKPRATPTGTTA